MEYVKCDVVMLPTKKAKIGTICKYVKLMPNHDPEIDKPLGSLCINQNYHVTEPNECFTPQELYFVTTEIVNIGDYYYDNHNELIIKATSQTDHKHYQYKKVIASTDDSLVIEGISLNNLTGWRQGFPRPTDGFVDKYCTLNGIREVLVGYERSYLKTGHRSHLDKRELHVASNGTIHTKGIKNIFNRVEMTDLLVKFNKEFASVNPLELQTWIDANLSHI